mgnify:CR=1 FL=1
MDEQVGIVLFGATAIWLSQSPNETTRRWGPVFGMASQPFWLYATWTAGQWGIFAMAIVYTIAWARGVRTYWFKKTETL